MITIKDVSFSYQKEDNGRALSHIDLVVQDGEVLLLCGESGCGKTTLTRLCNGLIPHYYEGTLEGEVIVEGHKVADTPLYDLSSVVGSVFQNPRSQFFSVDTTSELVFGCENQGLPEEEILARMENVVRQFSIADLMGRNIFNLSGGEKQKLACAGVSMLSPQVIVLDEPTSNLDVAGIHMLGEVLRRWKQEGKTIIIAEHRLWFLRDLVDRVLYLSQGEIAETWTGPEFFKKEPVFFQERGLRSAIHRVPVLTQPKIGGESMCLENVRYSYVRGKTVLEIPWLEFPLGRVIAVVGKNGAGKSTLVQSLCGLLKHDKSTLTLRGKTYPAKKRMNLCFPVMQDVNHQLFTESVLDEVLLSMEKEDESLAEQFLKDMDLLPYKDLHPMSLSGGQKQRVAIASALASEREILIFDEPTSGLDLHHMEQVADSVRYLKENGKTVLIVTHDAELISACCDWVITLEQGHLRPYDESFFA